MLASGHAADARPDRIPGAQPFRPVGGAPPAPSCFGPHPWAARAGLSPARRRTLFLGATPGGLLPLLSLGTERGVSLAMWADSPVPPFPPQVEVSPDLEPAVEWADYVGLALDADWLEVHASPASILDAARRTRLGEGLVVTPLPCGTGMRGACAG